MTAILVLGDSHCNQFKSCTNVVHFKNTVVFTAQRFVEEHSELWEKLKPWISAQKDQEYFMLLSAGEIDIRGHYWRQFPRHSTCINSWIQEICRNYFQKVQQFMLAHRISRCVLWGPPPASHNTKYNPHWPFSGSVAVRNRMINVYNRTMIEFVQSNPQKDIAFATGFYDHIAPDSYLPLDHLPTDGVHWHTNLTQKFWDTLITPAFSETLISLNSTTYETMKQHQYRLDFVHCEENSLHDVWIAVDHCQGDHCVNVDGQFYEYKTIKDNKVFKNYKELTLTSQV